MDDLMDRLGFYFWVIIVGFVGGVLSLENDFHKPIHSGKAIVNSIISAISSMFICWIFYEVTFHFTKEDPFSLAVGGFFAWRGTAWIRATVDKAIDKKIDGFGGGDDFSNLPRPPKDLNF
nr:hypothetical protein [uncultured Campylobacter sp.]